MATTDLTTLSAVKAWYPEMASSTTNDALLSTLITAASGWITSYLNRNILTQDYTETYRGNGSNRMVLRQGPITAVSSVAFSGVTITTQASGNPLSGGFFFNGWDSVLELYGPIPACAYCVDRFPYREPVSISYTAGFETAPPEIAQACNELVCEAFQRRTRIGVNSKTLGGQETIAFLVKDMSEPTRTALNNYRRVVSA